MGSPTPFFATRMGDYVIDRDLDALDEQRLREDDLDTEARNSMTYQEWLEEMAELNPAEQTAVINALMQSNTFSRWVIECATTAAFERAVKTKIKEL